MSLTSSTATGWPVGQCTWFVEQFINMPCVLAGGCNAGSWLDNAHALGWQTSNTPVPGAIAVFRPGVSGAGNDGHVAMVNGVDGNGGFSTLESNFNGIQASLDSAGNLVGATSRSLGNGAASGFIIPPASAVIRPLPSGATANGATMLTDASASSSGGDWGPGGMFNFLKGFATRAALFLVGLVLLAVALYVLFRPDVGRVAGHAAEVAAA